MSFSLVLTTYNRYETFLKPNLERYINNPHIHEIIVYDDCSDDYHKVVSEFPSVRAFTQTKNVGALRNKIIACKQATSEWICLMDSDNYCGPDYFEAVISYWKTVSPSPKTIYAPAFARPRFNYHNFCGVSITPSSWNKMLSVPMFDCLANTGNYIFHNSMVKHWDSILGSSINTYAIDAMYMTYFLVKAGASVVVVKGMEYDHCVHPGSFYINTSSQSQQFMASHSWFIDTI